MVATLVRLRFLILGNTLRRSPWQIVLAVLGGLYGLLILVSAVVGLIALGFAEVELASTVIVLVGAAVVLGWTILPVLTSGIDQTVDVARLMTFPIPARTLAIGLTVSGVLGVPGLVTLLVSLTTAATWIRYPIASLAAIVCAVIVTLTCVIGSRTLVAITTRLGSGRRSRELRSVLIFIPIMLLGPVLFLASRGLDGVIGRLPRIADIVGWTPLGAVWAVPGDIAGGDYPRAALEFLIALATLAAVSLSWRSVLARTLENPVRESTSRRHKRGLGLFAVFPANPTGAIAARALTYWYRDPRYAQSLLTIPLVPLIIFVYAGANGNLEALNAVGPLSALLLSMSIYTDVSYDNTAFALHVQTGVSGRSDRRGRIIALASFAAPVLIALTVGSVAVSGTWSSLPGLLGIVVGAFLGGMAVSSIVSASFTFPVPAPGDSPFAAKPGGGISLLLSTFATWGVLTIITLPELALAIVGFVLDEPLWGWLSLLVGVSLGSALLVVGIRWGGSILDRRGTILLSRLRDDK